jgi:50S ribosomal protein L16 3-hydroxylase
MQQPGSLRLDVETFLARHWQREPLLIRDAVADFMPPLDADELAGLAMEDGIESRIIDYVDQQWHLEHGPFDDNAFRRPTPWTLLVQAVDHHVPEVARLRRLVDFLPQWRMDDVMVSYAVNGGSVGPHYDNYDVFLLQGEGHRSWQVGQRCNEYTPLLPHPELRILADFQPEAEYRLGPGDVLYLPPGVAHWGIADGECTTFSLGFRAPRLQDLVSRYCDALLEALPAGQFYSDAGLQAARRPGEIRQQDLRRVATQLQAALHTDVGPRWLGELVTEPRYDPFPEDDELAEALAELRDGRCEVALATDSRLAWIDGNERILVFANGESREFPATVRSMLLDLLSGQALAAGSYGGVDRCSLLEYLLQTGCIYVE